MSPSTKHPTAHLATARLSDAQLVELRRLVSDIHREHEQRAHDTEDLFRALSMDSTVDVSERQVARLAAAGARDVCDQAEQALHALDEGTYGECVSCGKEIPFERLEAVPLTRTCVACQAR